MIFSLFNYLIMTNIHIFRAELRTKLEQIDEDLSKVRTSNAKVYFFFFKKNKNKNNIEYFFINYYFILNRQMKQY